MIKFNDFSYIYQSGEGGVKRINLDIKDGEFVVLCGRSGCGKTTLIRAINGLAFHFYKGKYSGEVLLDGKDISEISANEICLQVGSVFQDPRSQFFDKRVEGEIAFGCENIGFLPDEIRARTDKAAERLSVTRLKSKELLKLSSGEKQKTAIASIYAMNPQIYVLDEPSSNLDEEATRELAAVLRRLKAEGKTIVIAEHRLNYLSELAERFILIEDGEKKAEFTPGEFMALTEEEISRRGLRSKRKCAIKKLVQQTQAETTCFQINNLSVKFKEPLFSGICLSAEKGDVVAIVGANGIGKTTLCRVISGLKREHTGDIWLNGKLLRKKERLKCTLLVLNGADNHTFTTSVSEEPMLGFDKKETEQKREQCKKLLAELNLLPLADRHPLTLSGGQKQRLSIVTALMQDKDIIILDEPTSGLDYDNMMGVSSAIQSAARQGKIILIVSHDIEFINNVATKVFEI